MQLDSQKQQVCAEHSLPFSYFCNTCSTAVCSPGWRSNLLLSSKARRAGKLEQKQSVYDTY